MIEVDQQLIRAALIAYLPREQLLEVIAAHLRRNYGRDHGKEGPAMTSVYKPTNCVACHKELWK